MAKIKNPMTVVSGGGATLITKRIDINGTYNASSDNADGYSQVVVEVPQYTDTSDATATAGDILDGVTAYARGQKITGNYVPLDTSDATATANDILDGETAYVDGVRITGNYVPLDTSDATATAGDILQGETAYVNGVKITGNYVAPTLGTKSITANGTYNASSDNLGGYSSVEVDVPVGETIYFTNDGRIYTENIVIPDTVTGSRLEANFQSCANLKTFVCNSPTMTSYSRYCLLGSYALTTLYLPFITNYDTGLFWAPIASVSAYAQFGSLGHPVTNIDPGAFGRGDGNFGTNWTFTIYVNANTLAEIPASVSGTAPWGLLYLSNIIYRNSTTGEIITQ